MCSQRPSRTSVLFLPQIHLTYGDEQDKFSNQGKTAPSGPLLLSVFEKHCCKHLWDLPITYKVTPSLALADLYAVVSTPCPYMLKYLLSNPKAVLKCEMVAFSAASCVNASSASKYHAAFYTVLAIAQSCRVMFTDRDMN